MKATKKPVEIEYYPCEKQYLQAIMQWSTDKRHIDLITEDDGFEYLEIETLEGTHEAYFGQCVIIKGVAGEVYPCRNDIFEATYNIN